ncbi:MAG: small, acid-soluble spore protein, alpha/beta type [Dorea sp.]|nr:small, acid-soluble spore protein, alpha/beta type [Dorea sp.]
MLTFRQNGSVGGYMVKKMIKREKQTPGKQLIMNEGS